MADRGVALRLKKLIEANQSLATVESCEELLPRLIVLAQEVTEAEAASFLPYDPARAVLEFALACNEVLGTSVGEVLRSNIALRLGEGIGGWVAANRQSLRIDDTANDTRFNRRADQCTGFLTRSILCVPVVYGDELLGVIEVLNAKSRSCFDETDQEILESFANLAAVAIVRARLLESRLEQQRLHIELQTAARIQALFWPKLPPPVAGSNLWAISIPAAFVGGDLYDIIPAADGSWLVYVADVCGKGLPASLIMAALWSRIRGEVVHHARPGPLLSAVNRAMYELFHEEGFFISIICARFSPRTGKLDLCAAGHPPPIHVTGKRAEMVRVSGGLPLGVIPEITYQETELTLQPTESLLLFTDGATDATSASQEMLGRNRLIEVLRNTPKPPRGPAIIARVQAWQGTREPLDDLTLVEIWRKH